MVDYDKYVMENNRPIAQIKHGIVIRFIYMMWGANLTREDLSPGLQPTSQLVSKLLLLREMLPTSNLSYYIESVRLTLQIIGKHTSAILFISLSCQNSGRAGCALSTQNFSSIFVCRWKNKNLMILKT